jgi:hypothetical protein
MGTANNGQIAIVQAIPFQCSSGGHGKRLKWFKSRSHKGCCFGTASNRQDSSAIVADNGLNSMLGLNQSLA